jgi:hypothetical protein
MKTFNTLRSVQEDYRRKQLGTGEPLIRPAGGQGTNRERYEQKKRRRGPRPSDKNPRGGGYR